MAGYLVVPDDACDWSGSQPEKLKPNPVRLGLFDLIRELEQVPFPYDRRSQGVCLLRLDELLAGMGILELQTDNQEWPFLITVKRRLRAVANEVSNMGVIHVPISCQLDLGGSNHLYARYAGKRIPLWRLFGSNPGINSIAGCQTYLFSETLS
jgi:hypothetical protein